MPNNDTSTAPPPIAASKARQWEVTRIHADNGNAFQTKKMAELMNDGWEFMSIQSGSQGCTSYAYFRRTVEQS